MPNGNRMAAQRQFLTYEEFSDRYDLYSECLLDDDEFGHVFLPSKDEGAIPQKDGTFWWSVSSGYCPYCSKSKGDYYVLVHGLGRHGYTCWYPTLTDALTAFENIKIYGFDRETSGFEFVY